LWEWYGCSPSCALLGRFAIGARVTLLWQHSANAKCQRVLVLALCLIIIIIRPHRSTTYVDAAYSYRPSSVVCRSVCLSVCHTSEPCKNGCTDRAAVWVEDLGGPGEPCIRWRSRSPVGRGKFLVENGRPIVKYRCIIWSSVQGQLNR